MVSSDKKPRRNGKIELKLRSSEKYVSPVRRAYIKFGSLLSSYCIWDIIFPFFDDSLVHQKYSLLDFTVSCEQRNPHHILLVHPLPVFFSSRRHKEEYIHIPYGYMGKASCH